MGASHDAGGLYERDAELAAVDRLIDAAVGGDGGLLSIEGGAGLGKTALARAAVDRAHARGLTVLSARGVELESQLGFGVARRLFRTVLAELGAGRRAELLSGVSGLAGPVLLVDRGARATRDAGVSGAPGTRDVGSNDAPATPDGAFARFHGLYWLLADLASDSPLLVVVDDAHWADEPTVTWLSYLASRLDGLAVGVLVTMRPAEANRRATLLRLGEPPATRLDLAPLSAAAVAARLHASSGSAVDERFAAACHDVTSGNPFLVSELTSELERRDLAPVAANVDAIGGLAPEGIARSVLTRLAALPPQARAVARALTVLNERAALRHVAALAGLDLDDATAGAVALAHADIIDPARTLRFAHPLLRSTVTTTINELELAALHLRAAQILDDDGTAPEDVAVHLLEAEPGGDAWVVDVLQRAGATALGRGAPGNAAVFLDRALREPPQADQRFGVLHELGQAEALVGSPDATVHLRAALEVAPDPGTHAAVASRLGWLLLLHDTGEVYTVLSAVVDEHEHHDRRAAAEVAAVLLNACAIEPDLVDHLPEVLRRARALAPAGSHADRTVTAVHSHRQAITADGAPTAIAGLLEAVDGGGLQATDDTLDTMQMVAWGMAYVDAFDAADALVARMLRHVHAVGSALSAGAIWCYRAMLELRRGRFADAVASGRTALDLFTGQQVDARRPQAAAYLIDALLECGRPQEAEDVLGDLPQLVEPGRGSDALFVSARARLRLAQGRPRDALDDARRAGVAVEALGATNPAVEPWRTTAAEALYALGDVQAAAALAAEELSFARRSEVPSAIGHALRIGGRIAAGDDGLALLSEATEVLTPSGARGELAHALVDRGAAERRRGRIGGARTHLRAGLDLATQCGATGLADTAVEELQASGARPRRRRSTGVGALTPSELRVARMAAEGLTNREVAQALFITAKTVEDHLGATYRKLAISSRTELAEALNG